MALSEEECSEILNYIREQVREFDPSAFEDVLVPVNPNEASHRQQLRNYSLALMRYYKQSGPTAYPHVLAALREVLPTEGGGPIQDIRVHLAEPDQALAGEASISLSRLPDPSPVIETLAVVLREIEEDR